MSILHESQTHRLRSNSPRNMVRTEQCTEISRFRQTTRSVGCNGQTKKHLTNI